MHGDRDEPEPDPLPIEDRYLDHGKVSSADSVTFGVHCGQTTEMPLDLDHDLELAFDVITCDPSEVKVLAREFRSPVKYKLAAVGASIVALGIVLAAAL